VGIGYACDAVLRCTFVVWDGDVTPQEWRDHADRMFADPTFPPGSNMLGDFSCGDAPSITEDALREIGERWSAQSGVLPQMRLAIVPNGAWDKAKYMVDKEITTERLRFILFNDLHGACGWLGIAPQQALPILKDIRTRLRATTQ
jgi:hypothetical protein